MPFLRWSSAAPAVCLGLFLIQRAARSRGNYYRSGLPPGQAGYLDGALSLLRIFAFRGCDCVRAVSDAAHKGCFLGKWESSFWIFTFPRPHGSGSGGHEDRPPKQNRSVLLCTRLRHGFSKGRCQVASDGGFPAFGIFLVLAAGAPRIATASSS